MKQNQLNSHNRKCLQRLHQIQKRPIKKTSKIKKVEFNEQTLKNTPNLSKEIESGREA